MRKSKMGSKRDGKGSPWQGPESWLAGEAGRTDPGSQAWILMHWMMVSNKRRLVTMGGEFDLAPQQMIALRILGAGPRKMSDLAHALFCDNSNVTGIVDRLEERGLVRREAAEGDRREAPGAHRGGRVDEGRDHEADGRAAAGDRLTFGERSEG